LTTVRAFFLIGVLATGLLGACGGGDSGGSGGATRTAAPSAAPALGTNKPVTSGDPYSDTGY